MLHGVEEQIIHLTELFQHILEHRIRYLIQTVLRRLYLSRIYEISAPLGGLKVKTLFSQSEDCRLAPLKCQVLNRMLQVLHRTCQTGDPIFCERHVVPYVTESVCRMHVK